jgi:uncharacterized RDD family membrane protein YckC
MSDDVNGVPQEMPMEPAVEMSEEEKAVRDNPLVVYARFWSRVGAFVIDVMFLGALGALLCLSLFDFLAGLGNKGFIIGAIISGLYFVLMLGGLGKGQTLGKIALGIRVVTHDGGVAPYGRILLRFLIFNAFFMNSILNLLFSESSSTAAYMLAAFLFLIPLVMCILVYVLILFHPQKRGFHDIAAGTYVIYTKYERFFSESGFKEAEARIAAPTAVSKAITKTAAICICMSVLYVGAICFSQNAMKTHMGATFDSMLDARAKIQRETGLSVNSVNINTFMNTGETNLSVVINTNKSPEELVLQTGKIDTITRKYPEFRKAGLFIVLVKEANIGIFRFNMSNSSQVRPPVK